MESLSDFLSSSVSLKQRIATLESEATSSSTMLTPEQAGEMARKVREEMSRLLSGAEAKLQQERQKSSRLEAELAAANAKLESQLASAADASSAAALKMSEELETLKAANKTLTADNTKLQEVLDETRDSNSSLVENVHSLTNFNVDLSASVERLEAELESARRKQGDSSKLEAKLADMEKRWRKAMAEQEKKMVRTLVRVGE
jgi:DNA repair exonuclease SbcCD ATPase subunit